MPLRNGGAAACSVPVCSFLYTKKSHATCSRREESNRRRGCEAMTGEQIENLESAMVVEKQGDLEAAKVGGGRAPAWHAVVKQRARRTRAS